jgi:hypothetical protein
MICRSLELARAAFAAAVEEKPTGRFMIRSRTRVVQRHPGGRLVSSLPPGNDPKVDPLLAKRAAAPNWSRARQNPQKAPTSRSP